jgi:hypothetical protein
MVRLRRPSVCFCPAEDIPPSAGHTLGVTPSGSPLPISVPRPLPRARANA